MSKGDRAAKSWPRLACAEEDQEDFTKTIQEAGQDLSNVVFSDSVIYTHCERSQLIWLLEEHISNNLIKVGKDFCKQRVGIPQGSSLSTLLCCYYLARMEKWRNLCDKDDKESLLMRYTDDFLFISTNQTKAKRFYESIKAEDTTFNVKISMDKSLHNLEIGVADEMYRLASGETMFPWCSYLFRMDTLSVQYDMNRYTNVILSDTLTINYQQPIQTLGKVVESSIRNRSLPIFLDVETNGIHVVIGNLYRHFLLAALKFLSCYREIKKIQGFQRCSDALMVKIIMDSIQVCHASAQAKMKRSHKGNNRLSNWPINRSSFHYLALHAFARIFAQRPSSKRWEKLLQDERQTFPGSKAAHQLYHQQITEAWVSCKTIIASIQ